MNKFKFGFVGIGLIGGSIAQTLRRVYPDCEIIVFNRSIESSKMALKDGTATSIAETVDESFRDCDYIFLCTPVERNVDYLKQLKEIISSNTIITDVGSVKGNIHKAVEDLNMEENFIGGHPMAGSEKTGYENANDHLVENAYYAITPTRFVNNDRVAEFDRIVKKMGAIPIRLNYKEHDHIVATISHLPHVIASSLVNLVKDNDSKAEHMKAIAAGGFKDITRIASSSPEMWEQICMTNSEEISIMLQKYIDSLEATKEKLNNHEANSIYDMFEKSRDYRNSINDNKNSIITNHYIIYCDIIDEMGAIATIATILATNGISIRNVGIVHNREFEEGVLRISFYEKEAAEQACVQLEKHNYRVTKRY